MYLTIQELTIEQFKSLIANLSSFFYIKKCFGAGDNGKFEVILYKLNLNEDFTYLRISFPNTLSEHKTFCYVYGIPNLKIKKSIKKLALPFYRFELDFYENLKKQLQSVLITQLVSDLVIRRLNHL